MAVIEWKEPALLWNGNLADAGRPRILEIRDDEFIPRFLQAMLGDDPTPFFQQHQIDDVYDVDKPLPLYQPLHGCYYLVTASLVCRRVGLPDKAIQRADNESVFFVIRRSTKDGEEAWIAEGEGGRWQRLESDDVLALAQGEDRLPMHPVSVCPKPKTPRSVFTDFIERDLHYGYIPVGNRKKYTDTVARTGQKVSSAAEVMDFFANTEDQANADLPVGEVGYSFRVALFQQRVQRPWAKLVQAAGKVPAVAPTDEVEQWLYMLVELGDYLKNNLPTLWDAIMNDSLVFLAAKPAMTNLYNRLEHRNVRKSGVDITVREAIKGLESEFDAVRGEEINTSEIYRNGSVSVVSVDYINGLVTGVRNSLAEEEETIQLAGGDESELIRLINHQVQPTLAPGQDPQYHLRTVYEYDPECPPIVSQQHSQPFTLAKFMDPDAPARLIHLEPPSMKPKDLRKYARGVGVVMSPEMQKLTNCFSGDSPDEIIASIKNCGGGSGLSIGMVCTFSIQIIFLVAFIVMFIFLILLNFVFWWLPFLRICLPIPRRT